MASDNRLALIKIYQSEVLEALQPLVHSYRKTNEKFRIIPTAKAFPKFLEGEGL